MLYIKDGKNNEAKVIAEKFFHENKHISLRQKNEINSRFIEDTLRYEQSLKVIPINISCFYE